MWFVSIKMDVPSNGIPNIIAEFMRFPCLMYSQVLELGIIVHSVVIGLSMGASNNTCTIKPLVAALCFHQMFEGMGLGGCILQVTNSMETQTLYRIKHP